MESKVIDRDIQSKAEQQSSRKVLSHAPALGDETRPDSATRYVHTVSSTNRRGHNTNGNITTNNDGDQQVVTHYDEEGQHDDTVETHDGSTIQSTTTAPGAIRVGGNDADDNSTTGVETNYNTELSQHLEQQDSTRLLEATLVVDEPKPPAREGTSSEHQDIVITATKVSSIPYRTLVAILIAFVAAILLPMTIPDTRRERNDQPSNDSSTTTRTRPTPPPTLQTIRERGSIQCLNFLTPFEGDCGGYCIWCKAVSSAVFNGDDSRVEFQQVQYSMGEMFEGVANGTLDLVVGLPTHNMERDVYERHTGVGFAFSPPVSYSGLSFNGIPEFVACAEAGDTLSGECSKLKVCSIDGSADILPVYEHLDGVAIVEVEDAASVVRGFVSGLCNVVPGSPPANRKVVNFYAGKEYDGPYGYGTKVFSKDPLALMSRGDDAEFADLVKWVVSATHAAEAMNITQHRSNEFPKTHVFGEENEDMFKHVIATTGNFNDMYERFVAPWQEPTQGPGAMNHISDGTTGLIYAFPFGDLDATPENPTELFPVGPIPNGTLEYIESHNQIRCGVVVPATKNRTGFAVFNESIQEWSGIDVDYCKAVASAVDIEIVTIVELSSVEEGFVSLDNKEIEIYAGARYNMQNDVREPTTGKGFSFSPCYYFFRGREDEALLSSSSTPLSCLALATREDDDQWSAFVRWIVWGTQYAEEDGLSTDDASEMPTIDFFGPNYRRMFNYMLFAVGNYGEIYERNLQSIIPRSGANLLNKGEHPLKIPWLSSFVN